MVGRILTCVCAFVCLLTVAAAQDDGARKAPASPPEEDSPDDLKAKCISENLGFPPGIADGYCSDWTPDHDIMPTEHGDGGSTLWFEPGVQQ